MCMKSVCFHGVFVEPTRPRALGKGETDRDRQIMTSNRQRLAESEIVKKRKKRRAGTVFGAIVTPCLD